MHFQTIVCYHFNIIFPLDTNFNDKIQFKNFFENLLHNCSFTKVLKKLRRICLICDLNSFLLLFPLVESRIVSTGRSGALINGQDCHFTDFLEKFLEM